MKKFSKKHNCGFTLTELQFSLAITLITLIAAISLYVFYWRTFVIGNTILDVYSNSRMAIGWISQDIRWAGQVVQSNGIYSTSDNEIVLQVPSIDNSGNDITSHYDYIIYMLQNGSLYRIINPDAVSSRANENRAIAQYCTSLKFSSGGIPLSQVPNLSTINTVAIYLPLNQSTISLSGAGTVNESMTPTTTIRLRNK